MTANNNQSSKATPMILTVGMKIPRSVGLHMEDGPIVCPAQIGDMEVRLPEAVFEGECTYVLSGDLCREGVAPTRATNITHRESADGRRTVLMAEDWAFRVPSRWLKNDRHGNSDRYVGLRVFLEHDTTSTPSWTHLEIVDAPVFVTAENRPHQIYIGRFINDPAALAAYYRKAYERQLFAAVRIQSPSVKARNTSVLNKFTEEAIAKQSATVWYNANVSDDEGDGESAGANDENTETASVVVAERPATRPSGRRSSPANSR